MFEFKAHESDVIIASWQPISPLHVAREVDTSTNYEISINCRGEHCAAIRLDDIDSVKRAFKECFRQLSGEASAHEVCVDDHTRVDPCNGVFIESDHAFTLDRGWQTKYQINPYYIDHLNRESDLALVGAACEALLYGFTHDVELASELLGRSGIRKYKNWKEFFEHLSSKIIPGGRLAYIDVYALPDYKQLKLGRLVFDDELVGDLHGNHPLSGFTFAITGKLKYFKNRNELIKLIEYYGGKVDSTVKRSTDYLITNGYSTTSRKVGLAMEYNTPPINEEGLFRMMGITPDRLDELKELIGLS